MTAEPSFQGERRSADAIESWIVIRVAAALEVPPAEIDVRTPLSSYGLDSLAAFTLVGDLADWLGGDLPAALLWEYPTIESLARHLAADRRGKDAWSPLVALQPLGCRPPLFLVP